MAWTLLIVSSMASLAANVAVADPNLVAQIVAAWPSFALIGAYKMLMWQERRCRDIRVSTIARKSASDLRQVAW
ncbi:hypothetical protein [Nonomuraea sp. NPDC049646]|uniref:hypothetical protein n=1 Tax=unclassified Nonomuraea TaxID=2593643 RepID=UPI0037BC1B61